MARDITVIQQQIIDLLATNGITVSGSRTSIRRKWTYVFAYCANVIESLFDSHKQENTDLINTLKPHRLTWYKELALRFQYGQDVEQDTGTYANIGLTDDQITEQKIIAQSAVTEVTTPTKISLRIKVAKEVDGDLVPLNDAQLAAFSAYIEKTKDAGVKIFKDSLPADTLKLNLDIFFNPLVLTSSGQRIDGIAEKPVLDAINQYLRNLPFNGEYANTRLMDALQQVDGVALVVKNSAKAKYGLFPFSEIDERYIPDAGYIRLAESDLTINYRPYVQY
jgi:hypothetical protein